MCFDEEYAPFQDKNKGSIQSRDIEKEIIKYLMKRGITSIQSFNCFSINHKEPESIVEMKRVNAIIRSEFKNYKGVYIYIDDSGCVLYVGIRKLAERVRFHYYESFGKYSGKNCEKHIKFFTQHQGNINILWALIETKEEQRRIKKELTDFLQPKYETMKKEGLLY
ncbi:hypothetical protein P5F75_17715 [Caldifermentibacillus hisashii]|uniref:hypothetical protein n=1 Tax=Caldifermentibacillus hisashii TaxID=996558 RepID=UPI002E22D1EE|nr:hypothetical protein [Caldifermentibacillus hisashii]